jgi:hypothetical protein
LIDGGAEILCCIVIFCHEGSCRWRVFCVVFVLRRRLSGFDLFSSSLSEGGRRAGGAGNKGEYNVNALIDSKF